MRWMVAIIGLALALPAVPMLGQPIVLIDEWGSLDALLENIDDIVATRARNALREHVDERSRNCALVACARVLHAASSLAASASLEEFVRARYADDCTLAHLDALCAMLRRHSLETYR